MSIPFAFEVALGCQVVRLRSVNRLSDSVNTRSQQHGGFKGEGYTYRTASMNHIYLS
ncbi:hypothetical protein [Candidatus Regiella insecticola]|uniref:hypothetical protein n=1 Tax=Candidatus Regiella insecticola TaxID=138073 RepID=UPI0018732FF9|nr:hypothetical protein [Candidatus Regiella insecticola]